MLLGVALFLTPVLVAGKVIRRFGLSRFMRIVVIVATVIFYVLYFFPLGAGWAFNVLAGTDGDLEWEWVSIVFAPALHAIAVSGAVLTLALSGEKLFSTSKNLG